MAGLDTIAEAARGAALWRDHRAAVIGFAVLGGFLFLVALVALMTWLAKG